MPTTTKVLARTAASTTANTVLYTQPNTTTTTIVTNIVVTNTTTAAATFSMAIDSVSIATSASVPANDSLFVDLKQVIPASNPAKTIVGSAANTSINFHISGVEIS